MIHQLFDEKGLPISPEYAAATAAPSDRKAFLASRKGALGASDIPAILGMSPWATEWEVWADKDGKLLDWEGDESTQAGNDFERPLLDTAQRKLGTLERNVRVAHATLPIAANLDARIVKDGTPVEAKTAGIVRPLTAIERDQWGEAMTDQVPNNYLIQVHAQLLVTGAELAYLFALIGGRGIIQYQIERSDSFCEKLGNICADWWEKHIVQGIEPERKPTPRLDVVKRLRRTPAKMVVFDEAPFELIKRRDELKAQAKVIKDEIEDVEAQILMELGDAEAAKLPDGRTFTYYEQKNKGYIVAPYTNRVMRIQKAPK